MERRAVDIPLDAAIRNKMKPLWDAYYNHGLISLKKYQRLTRSTPFTDDEKWDFINRQLVETRQSTKALAILLKGSSLIRRLSTPRQGFLLIFGMSLVS